MSHSGDSKHSNVKLYWIICVVLVVITAVEYGIFKTPYFLERPSLMVPLLLLLSLVKFVLVVGWYMHLKFDPKLFKAMFIVSLIMAVGTGIVVNLVVAK